MGDTDVYGAHLKAIQEDLAEIRTDNRKIADALERLTRLEERHIATSSALERAFKSLDKMEIRIAKLESSQPVQSITSTWITDGVKAFLIAAILFLFKKIGVM